MEVTVKLFDPEQLVNNGRRYENLGAMFDAFSEYMKRKDRFVTLERDAELSHPINLEDIVGTVKHVEWKDQQAFANVQLLDTPNGKAIQQMFNVMPNNVCITPYFRYNKVGDKLLDLKIERVIVQQKETE